MRAQLSRERRRALREAVAKHRRHAGSRPLRVAEPHQGGWRVNQWLKKAVLLSFRISDNESCRPGPEFLRQECR